MVATRAKNVTPLRLILMLVLHHTSRLVCLFPASLGLFHTGSMSYLKPISAESRNRLTSGYTALILAIRSFV
jgi:hypothetical protein